MEAAAEDEDPLPDSDVADVLTECVGDPSVIAVETTHTGVVDDGAELFVDDEEGIHHGETHGAGETHGDTGIVPAPLPSGIAPHVALADEPKIAERVFPALPSPEFIARLPLRYNVPWGGTLTFYKSGDFEITCPNPNHTKLCRQTRKGRLLRILKKGQSTCYGHGRPIRHLLAWSKNGLAKREDGTDKYASRVDHYPHMPSYQDRMEMEEFLTTDPDAKDILGCERDLEPGEKEALHFE